MSVILQAQIDPAYLNAMVTNHPEFMDQDPKRVLCEVMATGLRTCDALAGTCLSDFNPSKMSVIVMTNEFNDPSVDRFNRSIKEIHDFRRGGMAFAHLVPDQTGELDPYSWYTLALIKKQVPDLQDFVDNIPLENLLRSAMSQPMPNVIIAGKNAEKFLTVPYEHGACYTQKQIE